MCSWSFSKQHQKRKCQKFQKKACFHEISCLPYISTCPNSSDNLQLNLRLLHSNKNEVSAWRLTHSATGVTVSSLLYVKVRSLACPQGHMCSELLSGHGRGDLNPSLSCLRLFVTLCMYNDYVLRLHSLIYSKLVSPRVLVPMTSNSFKC